jgi:hypothetical protein
MNEWSFGRIIIGRGRPKYLDDNLPQCQFVHDKSHMNNTGWGWTQASGDMLTNKHYIMCLSLSLTLRLTVSRSVCLGIKHPSWAYNQIFITVRQLRVCDVGRSLWWEDGSAVYNCSWPLPAQSFWVWVLWDSWPYFAVSDSRLPFSLPPMTRGVTVEVFDPVSTRESLHHMCLKF